VVFVRVLRLSVGGVWIRCVGNRAGRKDKKFGDQLFRERAGHV
jgi:hypothetical protein